MKQIYTLLLLILVLNVFSQNDIVKNKQDTLTYKYDLDKFYTFLSDNYDYYKSIGFKNVDTLSVLEKECSKILWFIHSKTKYVEQEMAVYDVTTYSYTTYDVGGKNYPKVYVAIYEIHNISQKIQKVKNEKKLKKLNLKFISTLDEYLDNYKPNTSQ